jgi:pimeloyl-ACP methyl ester carboxylesterase
MTYELMAADVKEFLDGERLGSASVLGHSMGGKTAMQLAFSDPQRVDKLVVVDVAPKAYPPGHHEIFEALLSVQLDKLRDRSHADEMLQAKIPELRVRQLLLKYLARDETGNFYWKFNLQGLWQNYARLNDGFPERMRFEKPALFIRGENSDYISEDDQFLIRRMFPAGKIETIAGAGHWVHAEQPETFTEVVLGFLGADL